MARQVNGVGELRLLVADRYPLVIEGIAAILGTCGHSVTVRAASIAAIDDGLAREDIDMAILDADLCGGLLADLLDTARRRRSPVPVVVTAARADNQALLDAIEGGVAGAVVKTDDSESLLRCVTAIGNGGHWRDKAAVALALARLNGTVLPLTRRERDVTRLVAEGRRNRVIADTLGISEGTVKMHLHNVYAKLGVESRTQLAMDDRIRCLG